MFRYLKWNGRLPWIPDCQAPGQPEFHRLIAIILIRGEDLSEDRCVVTMHQGNQSILSSTVSYIYLLPIEFEVRTVSYGPTLFSFIFAGLKFGEHFLGTFHESLQCDYSNRGHPTKFSTNLTNKNRGG